jgi:surface polysaccharide O-acyltransferase-like enzyme
MNASENMIHIKPQPDVGIQLLKGIMSILVVWFHIGGFKRSEIYNVKQFHLHHFTFGDLLNFHLLLSIVPCFILISCYYIAAEKRDNSYAWKRINSLLMLSLFWSTLFILFNHGYKGFTMFKINHFQDAWLLFIHSGKTIYYFFISLLFANALTILIQNKSIFFYWTGFILSSLLLIALPWLAIYFKEPLFAAYYNPFNFIIFAFVAHLLQQYPITKKYGLYLLLFIATLGVGMYEWNFIKNTIYYKIQTYGMPTYSRYSLVFSATLLFTIFYALKIHSNAVIEFISKNSLGLFCVHVFYVPIINKATIHIGLTGWTLRSFNFILILTISYFTIFILRKYILQKQLL